MDLQSRKDSAMNEVIVNGVDLTPPKPDTLRPGLETLVFLLKNPHMLFGWPSERLADCRWPVDWDRLPERLHRILARSKPSKRGERWQHDSICADCIWNFRLAALVLRERDVAICKGPMEIQFWEDECGDPHVAIDLNLDVSPDEAYQLLTAYGHRSAVQRHPIDGILLMFRSPRGFKEATQEDEPCQSAQEI